MSKINDQIEKLKKAIASPGTPEAFKTKMREQLATLEKQAEKPKESPTPKEEPISAAKPKKARSAEISEGGDPSCEDLLETFHERRKKAKEAAAERKDIPVFTKIAGHLVDAVIKAIDNVPVKEIKREPKKYFRNFEYLKEKAEDSLKEFKEVLGKDYSTAQGEAEIRELDKYIGHLQDKYGK